MPISLPVLSFTFLRDYENCPRKAWHRFVAKDLPKEPMSEEMKYGIEVHQAFEQALKGKPMATVHMPKFVQPLLAVQAPRLVEAQLGMASGGQPCSFWDPDVFLRGKIDVAIVNGPAAYIVDWKTGKPWEDPAELEIFSLLLQAHYPDLEIVTGNYVWLKEDRLGTLYDLSTVQDRWNEVHKVHDEIHTRPETEWPPTPNKLCGWCPVKTCEHWRER